MSNVACPSRDEVRLRNAEVTPALAAMAAEPVVVQAQLAEGVELD
jgi:hypothetical protein